MKILFLLVGTVLLVSCTALAPLPEGTPDWLRLKVVRWTWMPDDSTPDAVYRYEYQGQTVYYFRAACCDKFNPIYDTQGKVVCSPDGGFTGRGDGNCPDFKDTATGGELLWEAVHR